MGYGLWGEGERAGWASWATLRGGGGSAESSISKQRRLHLRLRLRLRLRLLESNRAGQYRAVPDVPDVPDNAAAAAGAEAVRHEPAQTITCPPLPRRPTSPCPPLSPTHGKSRRPPSTGHPSPQHEDPLLPSFENPQSVTSTVVTSAAVGQQPPLAAGTTAPECAFPITCPYPKPPPIFVSQHDTTRHDTTQC